MALSGAGIGQIRASLKKLLDVPSRAAPVAAVEVDNLLQDCFAGEHDPYGNAWAPLAQSTVKRKHGNTVIMYRTGASRAQTHAVAAQGAGVKISVGPKMEYHLAQSGTRPPRPILPIYGLPATWRAAIKRTADAAFARASK